MDSVFRFYNVCEDVSEIIAKKVHEGYQKEINKHLSVIIGWDPRFDYWTFGNYKPRNLFWPYSEPEGFRYTTRTIIHEFWKLCNTKFKIKTQNITKEEYLMYVLSEKQVFKMSRPVRWNRFIDALDNRYHPAPEKKLSEYFKGITEPLNCKYTNLDSVLIRMKCFRSETICPILSFIFKENLLKRELINWLNENGDPRKLTSKTKKELWRIILKLK